MKTVFIKLSIAQMQDSWWKEIKLLKYVRFLMEGNQVAQILPLIHLSIPFKSAFDETIL